MTFYQLVMPIYYKADSTNFAPDSVLSLRCGKREFRAALLRFFTSTSEAHLEMESNPDYSASEGIF